MTITTMTSRELNQAVTKAKKSAHSGPVFITERGKLAHVLLSFEEYKRLTQQHRSIAKALAIPEPEEILFDPPKSNITLKIADFS